MLFIEWNDDVRNPHRHISCFLRFSQEMRHAEALHIWHIIKIFLQFSLRALENGGKLLPAIFVNKFFCCYLYGVERQHGNCRNRAEYRKIQRRFSGTTRFVIADVL